MSLKKAYQLDAVARTQGGGEAHLIRKVEAVAIPVFQFGMFSDVDLSFFAGPNFNFGGRVHTNANLFLAEGGGQTLTLTDKVTAVGEIIRKRMQNGVLITTPSTHDGTISMATSTNTFRNLLATEGSVTDSIPPASVRTPNPTWTTTSLTSYNGYIRNGGCQQPIPAGCSNPPTGTGAKPLNLDIVSKAINGHNTDLSWRPKVGEDVTDTTLFGERLFGKVSLRILLSDAPADITNLPTVTGLAPVRLGDDGTLGAGLTNDWAVGDAPNNGGALAFIPVPAPTNFANNYPAGVGRMTPISRSPGVQTITTTAPTAALCAGPNCTINVSVANGGGATPNLAPGSVYNSPLTPDLRHVYQPGACRPGGHSLSNDAVHERDRDAVPDVLARCRQSPRRPGWLRHQSQGWQLGRSNVRHNGGRCRRRSGRDQELHRGQHGLGVRRTRSGCRAMPPLKTGTS